MASQATPTISEDTAFQFHSHQHVQKQYYTCVEVLAQDPCRYYEKTASFCHVHSVHIHLSVAILKRETTEHVAHS